MTGKQFRKGIINDDRSITRLVKLMGMSRPNLYWIFEKRSVPEKFILKARGAGIVFPHEELAKLNKRIKELEAEVSELQANLKERDGELMVYREFNRLKEKIETGKF